jgi:hypothetical protein
MKLRALFGFDYGNSVIRLALTGLSDAVGQMAAIFLISLHSLFMCLR